MDLLLLLNYHDGIPNPAPQVDNWDNATLVRSRGICNVSFAEHDAVSCFFHCCCCCCCCCYCRHCCSMRTDYGRHGDVYLYSLGASSFYHEYGRDYYQTKLSPQTQPQPEAKTVIIAHANKGSAEMASSLQGSSVAQRTVILPTQSS